ncbi:MAG: metal-dependent hydrolase [Thermodesulfobacteriota bacterium]
MPQNTLTWHGHANFQITTPNLSILIDPWFEGNPSAITESESMKNVDMVCVTHDHQDHIGQAVDICRSTGARFLGIVETAGKVAAEGVPSEQIVNGIGMNIGGTVRIQDVAVTMVQAFHSAASGAPVGFIFQLENGFTIYHAGDTGIFSSMELFGQLYTIDLAILPIGGVFTMDPRHAALACKLLQCKRVVPMHWGSFPVLEQNTAWFEEEIDKVSPETGISVLQVGKPLELPDTSRCEC